MAHSDKGINKQTNGEKAKLFENRNDADGFDRNNILDEELLEIEFHIWFDSHTRFSHETDNICMVTNSMVRILNFETSIYRHCEIENSDIVRNAV